jgi:hypothetical protein
MGEKSYLIYQVAVGETPAFYEDCISSVARYCHRHGYIHLVQRKPRLKIAPLASERSANALRLGFLPILEKENALEYFDRYEKVAVLDADVYVRDSAPCIFSETHADFAGVVEREMPLTPQYFQKIRKYSEGQYRRLDDVDWKWDENGAEFFNMGVMVMGQGVGRRLHGQTPEQFLRRPEFERFVNGEGHWRWSTDQTLLNWWVKKSGMTTHHLGWRWNALYGAVPQAVRGHFVHFFLSAKMPKRGAEIPEIIRGL